MSYQGRGGSGYGGGGSGYSGGSGGSGGSGYGGRPGRPGYGRPGRPGYPRRRYPMRRHYRRYPMYFPRRRRGYGGGYGFPRNNMAICRIVAQIMQANPGAIDDIQMLLMRHGIFCPGLPMGGYGRGGRGRDGYGNGRPGRPGGGNGGSGYGGGSSSYYSNAQHPPQVLPSFAELSEDNILSRL